jgi:hypothetical protein
MKEWKTNKTVEELTKEREDLLDKWIERSENS